MSDIPWYCFDIRPDIVKANYPARLNIQSIFLLAGPGHPPLLRTLSLQRNSLSQEMAAWKKMKKGKEKRGKLQ